VCYYLATLLGWWRNNDIKLKADMNLFSNEERAQQQAQRAVERSGLIQVANRLLIPLSDASADEQVVDAVHAFLAKTASALVTVQLDDLIGEIDQVNLPGTFLEYPNWRRKYRLTLEEVLVDGMAARLKRINDLRDAIAY
jgi:4-alpha-glucanotransferase